MAQATLRVWLIAYLNELALKQTRQCLWQPRGQLPDSSASSTLAYHEHAFAQLHTRGAHRQTAYMHIQYTHNL